MKLKKILSAVISAVMLFSSINVPVSAEEELKENSWRYKDGVPIEVMPDNEENDEVAALMASPTMEGIDVSHHQGVIDWDSVYGNIDYAIIRCGYGSDNTAQDDSQWYNNANACTRLGIPFGVYIYSYANTVEKAASEAQHVLRLVNGYNLSFPIYFDMEDNVQAVLSSSERGAIASTFCNAIQSAGYEVGIYANKNWWENYLTDSAFNNSSWYKWVAQYNTSCTYSGSYTMWQYTSSGSVNGISGNVDMNYWYGDWRGVGGAATVSSSEAVKTRISSLKSTMDGRCWNAGKSEAELISAMNSGDYSFGLTDSYCSLSVNDAAHHLTAYGCTSNTFNGSRQCAGFAYYMGYAVFGSKVSEANGWTKYTSSSGITLEPGDIIRYGGHSAMVWYTEGDTLYVAEANWWNNQKRWCQVHFGESWSSVSEVLSNLQYIWKHPTNSSGVETPVEKNTIGSRSVSGDFNGDGRDDYATLYDYGKGRAQWHVFVSTGDGFSEEIWWQELTEWWYGAANVSGRVAAGDFNGDGFDDVAVMYSYDTFNTQIHVFLSNGKSFDGWRPWYTDSVSYQSSQVLDRFVAGDFNGDGKDDIAAMFEYDTYHTKIHVFLSNGDSFEGWQPWYEDEISYQSERVTGKVASGDFNGDGKDDIAAMFEYDTYHTKIHVFLSNGNSFEGWQPWYEDEISYQSERAKGRFVAGDFDGDGLDDIATMFQYEDYKGTIHVFLSKGDGLQHWYDWSTDTQFAPENIKGRFVAGDFDGDKKCDIGTMYDYSSEYIIFHMYISNGSNFSHEWWNQINGYNANRTTGVRAFEDDYTTQFNFNKKEIPKPIKQWEYIIHSIKKINSENVDVSVTNDNSNEGTIFMSLFDSDDRFIGMVSKATDIPLNATKDIRMSINKNGVDKVEVYIWDSINGMKPLAEKAIGDF